MSLPVHSVSGDPVLGVCCVLSSVVGPTGIRIQADMNAGTHRRGGPSFYFSLWGLVWHQGWGPDVCSPDVRSMTGACGRHLHATSCRLLQPLLVSTPLSLSLSLSLSDTQTPPLHKKRKIPPKKRHLSISPLLPLSWIFQSQKKIPPPPSAPALLRKLQHA